MTDLRTEPPLERPYYGAPLSAAVRRFFRKYATFSGRASRSEYWWWFLASVVITGVLQLPAVATGAIEMQSNGTYTVVGGPGLIFAVLYVVWGLGTIIPGLALLVRRLHDIDHSGFWVFIALVPLIGAIVLFVFTVLGPRPGGARFDR